MYWDQAEPDPNKFLREGGHRRCPVHALRWEHVPPDAYGNGPVADALGDVAGLQIMEKSLVKGIELKQGTKDIQGPPGVQGRSPGDFNGATFYPVAGATEYKPLIDPRSIQLADTQWLHADLKERIKTACFNNLFLMFLNNDRRQMTATETMERAREKLLIGPVLHNINNELLNPTIDNILDVLFAESERFWAQGEAGMLPLPPQELQGAQLKIDYISELQQAQRATRAEPIYRLATFVGQFAQLDPSMSMKFDWNQAVDDLGAALGAPPKLVRDDQTVQAMMQEQAQQQAAAQQQQEALNQSQVVKNLGTAKSEPGTVLGDMNAEAA
jgi:hypothetical protein